jgi:hypothetical protein
MTVRAFSGTLRRILGGVEVFWEEPLTAASGAAVAYNLVADRVFEPFIPIENAETSF